MKVTRKIVLRAVKTGKVIVSFLFWALLTAMSFYSGFLDINTTSLKLKYFNTIAIPIAIIIFIVVFWDAIAKSKKEEPLIKGTYAAGDLNEKTNAYVLNELLSLKTSGKFRKIIRRHQDEIGKYISTLIQQMSGHIDGIVNEDTLRRFDKAGNDPSKHRTLMLSLFNSLTGFKELDTYIRKTHQASLDEIEGTLLDWVKNNITLKTYYESFKPSDFAGAYDRKKFNLDLDDPEMTIRNQHGSRKSISLGNLFSAKANTADMSLASMFAIFGLDMGDVGDVLHDEVTGELTEEVLYQILEGIGIGLTMVGSAFVILKIIRFLYRNRDRSEDIAHLRVSIRESMTEHLTDISDRTKTRIEDDSYEYIDALEEAFKEKLKKAKFYKEKAQSEL